MTGRRGLTTAALICLAGGALMLFAVGRAWVSFQVAEPGLASLAGRASGHDVASIVFGLGLVGLAGTAALPATRGRVRGVVGVLLIAAAVATVVAVVLVAADPSGLLEPVATRQVGHAGARVSDVHLSGWPWAALAGGLLVAAAGAFTIWFGRSWPAMGRRYDRRPRPTGELDMWDAIDRGEDPTA